MSILRPLILVLCTLGGALVGNMSCAQSTACDNTLDLCGQVDTTFATASPMDLVNAAALDGVFSANRVQVVTFHTTFLNPGDQGLKVLLSKLDCGADFQARVFLPNPFEPCDASAYVPVSETMVSNNDTVLTTDPLYINTDYILLVGTGTNNCQMQVRLEGPSVSIDACCTTTIDYGETADVEVLGADPTLGFVWTPEEQAEMVGNQLATLSPYETTTFEVTGFVEGCAYSDAVLVAVGSPIEVPNAFSPNADSFNDTWDIFGLAQFDFSTIEVFDRWGQSVFRSVSYPNPWGGKFRGTDVPAGTYYYVIQLNEPNANLAPITGHVAVIR